MEAGYLREKFNAIEDKRHPSYIEHKLADALIIIMSAVLCGLDGLAEIMEHAKNRAEFFKNKYGINEIPSKPTLSRILNMLDGDAVSKVIIKIMKERSDIIGSIIAVDGKAIRSTSKEGQACSALQILTAYLTESSVVIGQQAIHEKTNEIPVFQAMLNLLDIKGKTITADAMHCQKETCKKIVEAGGHYVFGLKENQKTLFNDVCLFISDPVNADSIEKFTKSENSHGRYEKRVCYKVTDISWMEGHDGWAGLKTVFAVRRVVVSKGKTTDETSYYITSSDVTAEKLLWIVREHWKIESMHWVLDVVFSEDKCALVSENGHKTLNILRKLALLLHKKFIATLPKKITIKASLLRCLMNDDALCNVLDCL
jgi:predicted transposase YbfD/YdcC